MPQRFYQEDDAEEILRLAARTSTAGGMSRERLLSTAAELGISPEAVEEAERTLATDKEQTRLRSDYERHVKSRFYSDLCSYLVVCGFLAGLNLYQNHWHSIGWSIWVIVFWGMQVAGEFAKTFVRNSRDYERGFERWKSRRNMGTPSDGARRWLASHPGDTKGAADYLQDAFELGDDEARSVVRSVQI